jgi:hypothetical protein
MMSSNLKLCIYQARMITGLGGDCCAASAAAQMLLHTGRVAPAHWQRLITIPQPQNNTVIGVFEALNPVGRNKVAAVNPHKALRKFFFQLLQRIVYQGLSVSMVHTDVFLVCAEKQHVIYRGQH